MKSGITRPRDQNIFKPPAERVRESLARLEGSIEGIKVFYPGVGGYMMDQVDTLYRILVTNREDEVLNLFDMKPSKAGVPERRVGKVIKRKNERV